MHEKGSQRRYCPIFLNIQGRKCVVVGGGKVASRKVRMLLEHGAHMTVISPVLCRELMRLAEAKVISVLRKNYESGDLKGAFMAIAATSDSDTNRKVASEARRRRILIGIADDAEQSDFIVPARLCRGDLTIAISTAGTSPALARKVKTRLEHYFGEEYVSLPDLVAEVRSELKKRAVVVGGDDWQKALDLDLLIGLLKAGQRKKAKAVLLDNLTGKAKT